MSVVHIVSIALLLFANALGSDAVSAADLNRQNTDFWDPLNLPKSFDARAKWYYCPYIGQIYDQGNCKSSYAISVASAVSDRICIHSGGSKKPKLSAQQIMTCCYLCGDGCEGGRHYEAWSFYHRHGFVSGGGYGSQEGCQPYTIEPCRHLSTPGESVCLNKNYTTPECQSKCSNPKFETSYANNKHRGTYYKVPGYLAMKEIYEKGPITASFSMQQDFIDYKSGVYEHREGRFWGFQSVKIIGWGEENGIPYWLAVNSFNTYWGENGFFKIRRGANECYIEDSMYAGVPL